LSSSDLASRLNRPPWHTCSTKELSQALGISFGRLSNWICRGQWGVEPAPRPLFRLTGNKTVWRVDSVVTWLTGVPADDQARRYLMSVGLFFEGHEIWELVRYWERLGTIWKHAWPPRDREAYLASLGT
jgi:hypothetical protein